MSANLRLPLYFDAHPHPDTLLALRPSGDMRYPFTKSVMCAQPFKPDHDALVAAGYQMVDDLPADVDAAVVHLTRSKQLNFGLIAQGYKALKEGGILLVDGAKTDGVESILKALRKLITVEDVLSKAHGKLFWLTRTNDTPDAFADWINALAPQQRSHGYVTSLGVFSAETVDNGSQQLAQTLPHNLQRDCADLGAGWGWLSDQVLRTNPALDTLHLYEADRIALDNAQTNIQDPRAHFHWEDVPSLTTDRRFHTVISNPPFHVTRKADPDLGRRFIHKAAQLLHPKGQFFMVANRHLAYESALDARFAHWELTSQTGQFKTFMARKPRP